MGARYVLIKGGHLAGPATDYLYDGEDLLEFSKVRIDTPHTHGTGCVFSAAIATYLAMELEIKEAVERAKNFIQTGACKSFCPLCSRAGKGPCR
jgi:hydroxymethylpyrimidine kinase/phosphomethylpyrimidine kinase